MGIIQVLSKKRKFDAISKMSPAEVEAVQKENIRSMLSYTISHSAFYREFYQGRKSDDLLREGFCSIPLTDKQMIMDNFDSVVTDRDLNFKVAEQWSAGSPFNKHHHNKFTFVHTSGTSGKIGIFAYDRDSWDTLRALAVSRVTDFSIRIPRARMAFIGMVDGHFGGLALVSGAPRAMAALSLSSVNEPTDRIVARLNKFQPDDLVGYISGLVILAQEQLEGRLKIKPKKITSSAEPLDRKTSNLIEEAFGQIPYNFYAASEDLCIAQDCNQHQGLHLFNDQAVVEILDKRGNPLEPGKSGEVVITNLYNRCQPLIRYQLHDVAAYSEEECECGLPFPLLNVVEGRDDDRFLWFQMANGAYEFVDTSIFQEFFVPGLRGMQVHQTERNRLKLMIVAAGDVTLVAAAVSKGAKDALACKGLQDTVEFEIEVVDSIQPDKKTGKTNVIMSRVGRPPIGGRL